MEDKQLLVNNLERYKSLLQFYKISTREHSMGELDNIKSMISYLKDRYKDYSISLLKIGTDSYDTIYTDTPENWEFSLDSKIILYIIDDDYALSLRGTKTNLNDIALFNDCIAETIKNYLKEYDLVRSSKIDALTGLNNRLSYEETLNILKGSNKDIGIVSIDLNRLKYINDNFGHEVGDKYILTFVDGLLSVFNNDLLFRIGGDEFIVISTINDLEVLEHKCDELKKKLFTMFVGKDNDALVSPSISCGFVTGNSKDIEELLVEADKKMYEDKAEFYRTSKYDRRK